MKKERVPSPLGDFLLRGNLIGSELLHVYRFETMFREIMFSKYMLSHIIRMLIRYTIRLCLLLDTLSEECASRGMHLVCLVETILFLMFIGMRVM